MARIIARLTRQGTLVSLCLLMHGQAPGSTTPHLEWTRQLQTETDAFSHGVAASPSGEIYVTGYARNSLPGQTFQGWDSFLSKYDSGGELLWTRSLNLAYLEESNAIAIDAAGDIYIAGSAGGSLDGLHYDGRDAFVSKFDSGGNLLWSRQFGAAGVDDIAQAMTIDPLGSIYLSGFTDGGLGEPGFGERDAFLAKFAADGTLLWKKLLGSETRDQSEAVAADSDGNVYITSATQVAYDSIYYRWVPYLSKFDSDGNLLWQQQQFNIGPYENDSVHPESLAVDTLGNVFISGETTQGGSSVATFIRKLDAEGVVDWTRRFSLFFDPSVVADGQGNVFLTAGEFDGRGRLTTAATVMKFDSDGEELWSILTDANGSDYSNAVATDGLGAVYIAGVGYPGFGTNPGQPHAFVTKFREVPEPAALVLLLFAGTLSLEMWRGQ